MVDTATILTSAGVAGTVTLLVEYAAKPHLEARKERILERHRRRREIITRVGDIALAAEGAERELRLARPGHRLVGELQPEVGTAFAELRARGEQLRAATRLDERLDEANRSALGYLSSATVSMGRTQGLDPEWSDASVLEVLTALRSNLGRRRFWGVTIGSPAKTRAERKAIDEWLAMMRSRSVQSRTQIYAAGPGDAPMTTCGPTDPPPPYGLP